MKYDTNQGMKDFLFVFLAWVLSLPLLIGAVVFALMNDGDVALSLNPFQAPVNVPVYAPVLAGVVLGIVLGALMTWAAMGRQRAKMRLQKKQIKTLEKQLEAVGQQHAAVTPSPTWLPQAPHLMIGHK